jgi:hypothetical protein
MIITAPEYFDVDVSTSAIIEPSSYFSLRLEQYSRINAHAYVAQYKRSVKTDDLLYVNIHQPWFYKDH